MEFFLIVKFLIIELKHFPLRRLFVLLSVSFVVFLEKRSTIWPIHSFYFQVFKFRFIFVPAFKLVDAFASTPVKFGRLTCIGTLWSH